MKKIAQIEMSVQQLNKVVGYEQMTLDLDYAFNTVKSSNKSTRELNFDLRNLDIPLKVCSLFSGCGMLENLLQREKLQ